MLTHITNLEAFTVLLVFDAGGVVFCSSVFIRFFINGYKLCINDEIILKILTHLKYLLLYYNMTTLNKRRLFILMLPIKCYILSSRLISTLLLQIVLRVHSNFVSLDHNYFLRTKNILFKSKLIYNIQIYG